MKFNDTLNYAFKNIGFKGLRSWLTIIGIVIGIASVVGLVTYSDSVNTQINNQLGSFGSQTITITAGSATRGMEMRFMQGLPGQRMNTVSTTTETPTLTDDDVNVLNRVTGLDAVSPSVSERLEIEYDDEISNAQVTFITPSEYKIVNAVNLEEGEFIDDNSNQVIIGYRVANEVFGNVISVGDEIKINEVTYTVAGILSEGGFNSGDNGILISINEISTLVTDWDDAYDSIAVKAESIDAINSLTEIITDKLRDSRDVEAGSEDFQVMSMNSIKNNVQDITSTMTLFLIGIAAISLLVGAISIANTMFTSVFEKTREIGIMKALGAEDNEVLSLFMTESAVISLIGGFGGIIIGLLVAQGLTSSSISSLMTRGPDSSLIAITINPVIIALALLFSLGIGLISGYLPARKAANMNPIEAIWYE